jgi:HD-like signal output (HDOD) protein
VEQNLVTLNEEEVSQVLANITIPPCPKVVASLVQEARSDDPDFGKLDKLLSGDVGLAAAVLKTANSPYYGLGKKAQSVKQALVVLGLRTVSSIVTMLALQKAFAATGISLDRFWERTNYHAIACARLARSLHAVPAEGAYTFGLFNDCGIPILAQRFPDYKETLKQANIEDRPFVVIENERHNTSHTMVGSILARNWQLPETICLAIREHHALELLYDQTTRASGDIGALRAISLVGDYLVNEFTERPQETEWTRHGAQAMSFLGMDEAELAEIYADAKEELSDARAYRG